MERDKDNYLMNEFSFFMNEVDFGEFPFGVCKNIPVVNFYLQV